MPDADIHPRLDPEQEEDRGEGEERCLPGVGSPDEEAQQKGPEKQERTQRQLDQEAIWVEERIAVSVETAVHVARLVPARVPRDVHQQAGVCGGGDVRLRP